MWGSESRGIVRFPGLDRRRTCCPGRIPVLGWDFVDSLFGRPKEHGRTDKEEPPRWGYVDVFAAAVNGRKCGGPHKGQPSPPAEGLAAGSDAASTLAGAAGRAWSSAAVVTTKRKKWQKDGKEVEYAAVPRPLA